jgi:inorganic phosphate transporter, PiT family
MSSLSLLALISLIGVALTFDFLNGVHDTANSIATIVATRKLQPRYAVAWAAFFNFVAFLVFGVHVARTVGVGIVSADVIDPRLIFAALMGAIIWNLITWWGGIPSSSSHALIGGLVGAGVTKAGIGSIVWSGLLTTGAFIVLSPLFGFLLALFLVLIVSWIFGYNLPRRLSFHLAMAGMMRKKPWGSLPYCCFRKVGLVRSSLSLSGL